MTDDKDFPDIEYVKTIITAYPDFPKPGILFRDIFPVLRDPVGSEIFYSRLTHHILSKFGKVDIIIGIDSRGFIFAPIIAQRLHCGFVPIRKKGKLPGDCLSLEYKTEYSKDCFDIQRNSIKPGQKVIIIDDLLATGGTMAAACQLAQGLNAEVLECICPIELKDLKGKEKFHPIPFYSILQY